MKLKPEFCIAFSICCIIGEYEILKQKSCSFLKPHSVLIVVVGLYLSIPEEKTGLVGPQPHGEGPSKG